MSRRLTQPQILLLVCALFFLGNWQIPVSDPVEVNYAETAAEMLSANDWVSPQIYGNYWYDKPVFFYWELMAAFKIFGQTDWAARFFPALFASLGVWLTYLAGRWLYAEKIGFWGGVILASSFIYWFVGKLIITDMTLFVFMNGSLLAFFWGYGQKKRRFYYLSYALAALATLTKGPVGLALPGLIILAFLLLRKDFRELLRLKLFSGLLLYLAICAPWYYQMFALHGKDFTDTFLGVHNILRATVSEHEKWNHWYFYSGIFFLGMLPWSFFLPLALKKWWRQGCRLEFSLATQFLLVWALGINLFFQCMATKYPTYSLPAFMPLAILTAKAAADFPRARKICAGVGVGLALIFIGALNFNLWEDGHFAGKKVAMVLKERLGAEDLVVSLGDYPASVVYYTSHPMYALEHREAIAARNTVEISWDRKNVMPYMALEDLPRNKTVYLVVEGHAFDRFQEELRAAEWEFIVAAPEKRTKLKLYCRKKKQEK